MDTSPVSGGERPDIFFSDYPFIRTIDHVITLPVIDGVVCDTYLFRDTSKEDLAKVRVEPGYKTHLQRVVSGNHTTEGYISGAGTLAVTATDGSKHLYEYSTSYNAGPVEVRVGQIMQWRADRDSELVFYEICDPPYQDGRFANLADS